MLCIVQLGHDPASDRYVRSTLRTVEKEGLSAEILSLPEDSTTEETVSAVKALGEREECRAILVQLPLPAQVDRDAVLAAIPEEKDLDGLNPRSLRLPLTPAAVLRFLKENGVELRGRNAVVLGRSELVGRPIASALIAEGATVTVLNSASYEWFRREACRAADILISAVGKAGAVSVDYVDNGRVMLVIDVGINNDAEGRLCGDVSLLAKATVERNGGYCSPVPGGVGSWTTRELVLRLKEFENA